MQFYRARGDPLSHRSLPIRAYGLVFRLRTSSEHILIVRALRVQENCPATSPSRKTRNFQVLADLTSQVIVDFCVTRDGRSCIQGRLVPPGMFCAFTEQLAAMLSQMTEKRLAFHTAIGASSKSPPAAPKAS